MTTPHVTIPRIPIPTITAMTIRITLRALLPPVGGAAGAGGGCTEAAGGAAAAPAPHLLQNFDPGSRVAPQELQNAIGHLVVGIVRTLTREYTADRRPQGLKPGTF